MKKTLLLTIGILGAVMLSGCTKTAQPNIPGMEMPSTKILADNKKVEVLKLVFIEVNIGETNVEDSQDVNIGGTNKGESDEKTF